MSYTPTNWSTGDTITASAMNKIENGIANAGDGSANVVIEINLSEGEVTSLEVIKSDPDIVSKFLADPSSVRPFAYAVDAEIEGMINPYISRFIYEDGLLRILAYDMYVRSTPSNVNYILLNYYNGTWVFD